MIREAREEAEPEDDTLVYTLIRSLNYAVDNFHASERENGCTPIRWNPIRWNPIT
jgi:hypothetical protein